VLRAGNDAQGGGGGDGLGARDERGELVAEGGGDAFVRLGLGLGLGRELRYLEWTLRSTSPASERCPEVASQHRVVALLHLASLELGVDAREG
jgi:hypothetical protein